jgi:rubrerythrin
VVGKMETNACKLLDEAIKDEKKGIEFYRNLSDKVLGKMIKEDRDNAIEVYNEIIRIVWDEEKHKDKLEEIKEMICD